jgi:phage shock protein E
MITFIKNLFKPKADFKKLVNEGAVIVDVRTKGEYQAGHIEGSKNIPLDGVKTQVQQLKKSGKPVITVCRSGNRSAIAKSILSSAGIEVYNGGARTSLKKQLQ